MKTWPCQKNDHDNIFLNLCNVRCNEAEEECINSKDTIILSEDDVEKAINKLNSGKPGDEYGLFSEHFKAGKSEIVPAITRVFNKILSDKKIPSVFKTGLITPVLKKERIQNYWNIIVGLLLPQYLVNYLNMPY